MQILENIRFLGTTIYSLLENWKRWLKKLKDVKWKSHSMKKGTGLLLLKKNE